MIDAATLAANLNNPAWRIANLYKIVAKSESEDELGLVIQFVPNAAQRRLLARLHYRNVILKARQLGFSTLVCILWLDTALFSKDPVRCGIIAQDKESAEALFRGKVKFAYDHLPDELRAKFPLSRENTSELEFGHNGASIRVATSMRSGTIHRLLVSEFGKICAKFPDKAKEVVTGSIPAVPSTGILVIESTAEGQDGEFYKITQRALDAQRSGKILTPKDYRLHFFAWWEAPEYAMDPTGVIFTDADRLYFQKVETIIKRKLSQEQRAWYVTTVASDFSGDAPSMWQEYPSCVVGDTLVSTANGIRRIRDIEPDGVQITNFMDKGKAPVYEIKTRLGYSVTCTDDHPILCSDGKYCQLVGGLSAGKRVQLARPEFGRTIQTVRYEPFGFLRSSVDITPELALFIGIYMGDGSFYDGTVSVACDAQDENAVAVISGLFDRYLGGSYERITGDKKGCVEIRKSSVGLKEPFLHLELIEPKNNGGMKRRVHVPDYIFASPKPVVAAFLRGLFEADGFCARDGTNIRFFSKHKRMCQDVQVLLLGFGIECLASAIEKKAGNGSTYLGNELRIRANGVRAFGREIGFISHRKNARVAIGAAKAPRTGFDFDMTDEITSITSAGMQPVYDITTATSNFIAGGIVVHNSPDEAFQISTEGCYYSAQLAKAREQGRVLPFIPVAPVPVNTFWDLGKGDMLTQWFHQQVGLEDRFIRYYENSGEDLSHYVTEMLKHGYVFGTHFLPHDAEHKRLGLDPDNNDSILEMLQKLLPGHRFEVIPRITNLQAGIQQTRDAFSSAVFDETNAGQGLIRLTNYRKRWNKLLGCWSLDPMHDDNSHGADAFRQWGQAKTSGIAFLRGPAKGGGFKRRGSPMAV